MAVTRPGETDFHAAVGTGYFVPLKRSESGYWGIGGPERLVQVIQEGGKALLIRTGQFSG